MHRVRAFTLLEVMVVVLLILIIMAVVAPIALSQIGRTAMDETPRQLGAAAMLARSDAQRRGVVLQLLVRPASGDAGGVEVITVDLAAPGADRSLQQGWGAVAPPGGFGDADSAGGPPSQADDPRSTGAGVETRRTQSVLTLPAGVQASGRLPDRFQVRSSETSETGLMDELDAGVRDLDAGDTATPGLQDIPLCVFFPDGQASPAAGCYFYASTGRAVMVRINRWTGAAAAEWIAVPGTGAATPAADEAADGADGDAGERSGSGRESEAVTSGGGGG